MLPFADALKCLALELGLPDLRPQADDTCTLTVGTVAVALLPYPERGGFALRSCLGNVATAGLADAAEQLLAANLFSDGPVSSVLSIDPSGDVYLGQHLREASLGPAAFGIIFQRFIRRATSWRQRLAPGMAP
jgi:hypothetical protein